MKKISKLLFLMLMLIAVFSLYGCTKKIDVSLSDYVDYNYEGYDGNGTCSPEIDYSRILKDHQEEMGEENALNAIRLLRKLEVSSDKTENLSNNEKINISFGSINTEEILNECGLNISGTDYEAVVTGLKELQAVDIFKGLDIKCSGFDGKGEAWIYTSDLQPELYFIRHKLTKTENLSNGEKVTVIAEDYKGRNNLEELLAELGYKAESLEYTYTVTGLDELAEYDPFSGISLVYKGINGNATAEIRTDYSVNDYIYLWDYTIDKSEGISNGDVINITASYEGEDIYEKAASRGLKLTSNTTSIIAEGINDPLANTESIPADVFAEMQANDIAKINEYFNKGESRSVEPGSLIDASYIGSIITYREPSSWNEEHSAMYNIYCCDVKASFDDERFVYWYSLYDGIVKDENGDFNFKDITPVCPSDNYKVSTFFVSGDVFTTEDKEHFYVGFDSLDNLKSKKIKTNQVIFDNVDTSEKNFAVSADVVLTLIDKDLNTISATEGSISGKASLFKTGPCSLKVVKDNLSDPQKGMDGLNKFIISVKDVEGLPFDLKNCTITDLSLKLDENEVELYPEYVLAQYDEENSTMNFTLFDGDAGVSGKKAVVRSKKFSFKETLELSFNVKSNEEIENNNETDENKENEEGNTDNVESGNNDNAETGNTDNVESGSNDSIETGSNDNIETGNNDNVETGNTDNVESGSNDSIETGNTDNIENQNTDNNKTDNTDNSTENENTLNKNTVYSVEVKKLSDDRIRMLQLLIKYTGRNMASSIDFVDNFNEGSGYLTETSDKEFALELKNVFEKYGAEIKITEK